MKIGGPATDGRPEDWIRGFVNEFSPRGLCNFVSFHKYPQWRSDRTDRDVMENTWEYRADAEQVRSWTPEDVMVILGELNFDANYNPVNPKIWQPINGAWYASVLNHLVRSGIDVEMYFRGSDKHGRKEFGLWNWENEVSYAFQAKKLFSTAIRQADALVEVTIYSRDWRIEAIAAQDIMTWEKSLILIHKDPNPGQTTYTLSGVEGFRAFVVDSTHGGEIHEVAFNGSSITVDGPTVVAITNYDLLSSWSPVAFWVSPRAGLSLVDQVVTIQTSYRDRESAYDIESASLWIDIVPPSPSNVPQSLHAQVKNKEGQFKYYGLRFKGGDPNDSNNYVWDVGGFDPGPEGRWICIDTDRTDQPCSEGSANTIAEWRVREVRASGIYLDVIWEIKFKGFFGDRLSERDALHVYAYVKDREGHGQVGGWIPLGVWVVSSSPTSLINPSFEVDDVGWKRVPTYWGSSPGTSRRTYFEIVDERRVERSKSLKVITDANSGGWYQGIEQSTKSPGPNARLKLSGYVHVKKGWTVINVIGYRIPLQLVVLGYAVIGQNENFQYFEIPFTTFSARIPNTGNIHIRIDGTNNKPDLGGTIFYVDGLRLTR